MDVVVVVEVVEAVVLVDVVEECICAVSARKWVVVTVGGGVPCRGDRGDRGVVVVVEVVVTVVIVVIVVTVGGGDRGDRGVVFVVEVASPASRSLNQPFPFLF